MADRLVVATWNVNSIRARLDLVSRFVAEHAPDVLCLQETRCPDGAFPLKAVRMLGYEHIEMNNGTKGHHGVAILSRRPLVNAEKTVLGEVDEPRHVAADVAFAGGAMRVHCLYVPAGGDEPDPAVNPKFDAKLRLLAAMKDFCAGISARGCGVLVGDLNIAPYPEDVWSHRQLLDVVSHTPVETEGLEAARLSGPMADVVRQAIPVPEKLYTWWSYRARDWAASDRGRRLDHVWTTEDLATRVTKVDVVRAARGWERASDHVPIVVTFEG